MLIKAVHACGLIDAFIIEANKEISNPELLQWLINQKQLVESFPAIKTYTTSAIKDMRVKLNCKPAKHGGCRNQGKRGPVLLYNRARPKVKPRTYYPTGSTMKSKYGG